MARLKGLLVDVGGVLIDERTWPSLVSGSFHDAALARFRECLPDHDAVFDGLWRVDQDHLVGNPLDGPDWAQTSHPYIANHLARHGLIATPELCVAICAAFAVPLLGWVSPVPEAHQALAVAKSLGLKMVVCSNTAVRSRADYVRDFRDFGLDTFFDAYITSLDVGFRKPHAVMFEAGLKALGTAPDETAMIGDRPERDIVGAKSLGMRTIWVRPPDFEGACHPPPDVEIERLDELAPVLERWVLG